ncbi:MAG: hypothetical protein AAFX05_11475 [Planctomycetota bacterium]
MRQSGRVWAYVGTGIGAFGWIIGAAGFAAVHGAWQVLGRMLPVGLSLSAGLTAMLFTLMLHGERAFGRGSRTWFLLLWGGILLFIGVGTLAMNHWLSPLMLSDPTLAAALSKTSAVHRVPDVAPIACLLASAMLLSLSLRAMPSSADEPRADHHGDRAHAEDSPADGR